MNWKITEKFLMPYSEGTRELENTTEGDSFSLFQLEDALVVEREGRTIRIKINGSSDACLTLEVDSNGRSIILP